MKCKKYIIFSTFVFSFFFCLFFGSSSVSATSVTCDLDTSQFGTSSAYDFSSVCDTSILDSSKYWTYKVSWTHGNWSGTSVNNYLTMFLARSTGTVYSNESSPFYFFQNSSNYNSYSRNGSVYISEQDPRYHFKYFRVSYGNFSNWNITQFSLKIYDDDPFVVPDCPVCEECQECPAVPDNPYDEKLDNITKAIYVCGAILLVIYFFYCIYRLIIHNLGGRL